MNDVAVKLDKINITLENMLGVMRQPANRFIRVLEIIGLGAGALGIINAIDIIRKWVMGG